MEKAGPYKTKKRGLIGDILMIYIVLIASLMLYDLYSSIAKKRGIQRRRKRKGKEEKENVEKKAFVAQWW